MKNAFVFPGQGAQYSGMGKELYEQNATARSLFETANDILGFRLSDIMFEGTAEELKQTKVTQPAVFLHSVAAFKVHSEFRPAGTAGHSLGEFSALVAAGALTFEDGLILVAKRAEAMQKACDITPSTMAAILGLDDDKVAEICASITSDVVVPANYNCPGQLVISGGKVGVGEACILMKEAGAKRALMLQVGGAFHSPLMEPARQELQSAIENTNFQEPRCPIYQNVDALPHTEPSVIRECLMQQLTAPVKWTQTMRQMLQDGFDHFTESGPGNVLQGLIKKVDREVVTIGIH